MKTEHVLNFLKSLLLICNPTYTSQPLLKVYTTLNPSQVLLSIAVQPAGLSVLCGRLGGCMKQRLTIYPYIPWT